MSTYFSLDHINPEEVMPNPEVYHFSPITKIMMNCGSRPEMLASDVGEEIETSINNLIKNKNDIKFLSFDVFDTYLLRNNKPEALRYLELSHLVLKQLRKKYPTRKKLKSLTAEDFCLARAMGMQATYRTRPMVQGCREGLIEEVIAMQCLVLGLDSDIEALLLETEIAYESENLTENKILSKIAHHFKGGGGKVVLVSDMYLGRDVIQTIIEKVVNKPMHDYLFSSADMVVSKRNGKIFSAIEECLDADGKELFHFGDSWIGDVQRPREAGWNALYLPISNNEKLERRKALESFISSMDKKGIETRGWAKV